MSFVENRILRKVQILVSNKLFDYTGDFVAAVNVLLVSVSMKPPIGSQNLKRNPRNTIWTWKGKLNPPVGGGGYAIKSSTGRLSPNVQPLAPFSHTYF